jgi:hypothetical protein
MALHLSFVSSLGMIKHSFLDFAAIFYKLVNFYQKKGASMQNFVQEKLPLFTAFAFVVKYFSASNH